MFKRKKKTSSWYEGFIRAQRDWNLYETGLIQYERNQTKQLTYKDEKWIINSLNDDAEYYIIHNFSNEYFVGYTDFIQNKTLRICEEQARLKKENVE